MKMTKWLHYSRLGWVRIKKYRCSNKKSLQPYFLRSYQWKTVQSPYDILYRPVPLFSHNLVCLRVEGIFHLQKVSNNRPGLFSDVFLIWRNIWNVIIALLLAVIEIIPGLIKDENWLRGKIKFTYFLLVCSLLSLQW